MKKNLFLFLVLLVFVVVGTPCALADETVDITVPSTTFIGNPPNVFLCPAPCTETISASFEYDNTTATVIPASVDINSMGQIGGYFFLDSFMFTNQVLFTFEDGTFGFLFLTIPSTSTGAIFPGVYTTDLHLTNDLPPFNRVDASAMVSVTPEPSAWMLVLGAVLLTLVIKWKTLFHQIDPLTGTRLPIGVRSQIQISKNGGML